MKNLCLLPVFLLAVLLGDQLHAGEAAFGDRWGSGVQIVLRLVDDYGTSAEVEEPQPVGAEVADPPASDATTTGAAPDLSGRMSTEEQREKLLEDAQATLDQIDGLLLEAHAEARSAGDATASGAGLEDLEKDGADGGTGSAAGGTMDEDPDASGTQEPDTAEGRLPGNVATGKSGRVGSYEEDDDIVARQVCDMAQREPDPEIKRKLEEKCKSLKSN